MHMNTRVWEILEKNREGSSAHEKPTELFCLQETTKGNYMNYNPLKPFNLLLS